MTAKLTHHAAQAGQSQLNMSLYTLRNGMPALDALFTKLAAGGGFNFLDILAAISEMVAFYTDHDILEGEDSTTICEMSGKYCRFCS